MLADYLSSIADIESNKSQEVNKMIYLTMVLIFIAHATITDSQNQISQNNNQLSTHQILKQAIQSEIPIIALK